MQIRIPEQVERIINKLNDNGYEAYAVGGCVRDTLLGRLPEDWDITTSATPEQIKSLFARTIDTGIQHGTVTILINHVGYEVTTYRIDGEYEDGRHPKTVEFTSDLLEDLKRRDFTINAMAYSHRTGIVDAFDGMADLKEKRIRCVGKPGERFGEDALRILRAIRFSAQLGFTIDTATKNAISLIAPNLVQVSKERIQVELTKLLLSSHPEQIKLVFETGISAYISSDWKGIDSGLINFGEGIPAVKYLRWAAFLKRNSEQEAVSILKDLKMDHDTVSKVSILVRWFKLDIPLDRVEIRKVMSQMTPELYEGTLLLKMSLADCSQEREYLEKIKAASDEIKNAGDCISLKNLAVNGNDLIAAGIRPGKEVGVILNRLFEAVLEHPDWNEKEVLIKKL